MDILFKLTCTLLIYLSFFSCSNGKGPEKAVQIAGGLMHVCVLSDQGKVFCWGDNAENQLSINAATNASGESYDLKKEEASQISAGTYHTCGLFKGGNRDGLPFCFGKSGPWLKVPNKKMHTIYAAYSRTCFLDEEGHLDCVGMDMQAMGASKIKIDPTLLVKNHGIDPISGNGGQDFSAKKFKNVRFDPHWAALCAQEIPTQKIYCMGQEDYPGVRDLFGVNARDFYLQGRAKPYIDAKDEKLDSVGNGVGFHPADNLAEPGDLKFKSIIAVTAPAGREGLVVASDNLYDDGTPIPEGTIIVLSAPKTLVFENAIDMVFGLGSTHAGGHNYRCLLMNSGKVDCKYFENGSEVSGNPIVKNMPSSLRVK